MHTVYRNFSLLYNIATQKRRDYLEYVLMCLINLLIFWQINSFEGKLSFFWFYEKKSLSTRVVQSRMKMSRKKRIEMFQLSFLTVPNRWEEIFSSSYVLWGKIFLAILFALTFFLKM